MEDTTLSARAVRARRFSDRGEAAVPFQERTSPSRSCRMTGHSGTRFFAFLRIPKIRCAHRPAVTLWGWMASILHRSQALLPVAGERGHRAHVTGGLYQRDWLLESGAHLRGEHGQQQCRGGCAGVTLRRAAGVAVFVADSELHGWGCGLAVRCGLGCAGGAILGGTAVKFLSQASVGPAVGFLILLGIVDLISPAELDRSVPE